jgi:hypothetical protein
MIVALRKRFGNADDERASLLESNEAPNTGDDTGDDTS